MSSPEILRPLPRSSWWHRAISAACVLGLIVGTIAQLTFRDWYPFPWSGVFYALPRPLLFVGAVAGLLTARGRLNRALWMLIVLALAGWVSQADISWSVSPTAEAGAEPIVFWNVGHDLPDDVAVVDRFLEKKPLMLGLVETGALSEDWLNVWRPRHPDYDMATAHRGLLLAVRGRILNREHLQLSNSSHALVVDAELERRRVRILVVDIAANPWVSRREPLTELADRLVTSADVPTIVMGDFNTPDDSVWFEPLRGQFREVFRSAGRGYVPTWPWPVPILKLDHIWVNDQVTVTRAWQRYSWHSDHRTQWAEVSWDANDSGEKKPGR